ncbi:hypothetical protein [Paenibacillus solani]|uniref:hypothetical protein n=1 Tax=Paenibacillus solani TaxID=1705565 RepID=UPI003D2843FE
MKSRILLWACLVMGIVMMASPVSASGVDSSPASKKERPRLLKNTLEGVGSIVDSTVSGLGQTLETGVEGIEQTLSPVEDLTVDTLKGTGETVKTILTSSDQPEVWIDQTLKTTTDTLDRTLQTVDEVVDKGTSTVKKTTNELVQTVEGTTKASLETVKNSLEDAGTLLNVQKPVPVPVPVPKPGEEEPVDVEEGMEPSQPPTDSHKEPVEMPLEKPSVPAVQQQEEDSTTPAVQEQVEKPSEQIGRPKPVDTVAVPEESEKSVVEKPIATEKIVDAQLTQANEPTDIDGQNLEQGQVSNRWIGEKVSPQVIEYRHEDTVKDAAELSHNPDNKTVERNTSSALSLNALALPLSESDYIIASSVIPAVTQGPANVSVSNGGMGSGGTLFQFMAVMSGWNSEASRSHVLSWPGSLYAMNSQWMGEPTSPPPQHLSSLEAA